MHLFHCDGYRELLYSDGDSVEKFMCGFIASRVVWAALPASLGKGIP